MTDRERLIEIIEKAGSMRQYPGSMASILIENGVTFVADNNVGRKGHWIIHSSGKGDYANNWAECSECRVCGSPQWKRCPVCEARMEVDNG